MSTVKIITTSDGSHSLLNADLNETYHSVHGAIQESEHVFIRNGLDYWLGKAGSKQIRILEIGFGTGLNVFLTLLRTPAGCEVFYQSWELFPLEEVVLKELNYGSILGSPGKFIEIHDGPWNCPVALTPAFTLSKCRGNILAEKIHDDFDLVYYDAFAPAKQPEMWTIEVLRKVTDSMSMGGAFVTYCAKGQVKRDLASLGLTVETLPGPPGKKEMIRGLRAWQLGTSFYT